MSQPARRLDANARVRVAQRAGEMAQHLGLGRAGQHAHRRQPDVGAGCAQDGQQRLNQGGRQGDGGHLVGQFDEPPLEVGTVGDGLQRDGQDGRTQAEQGLLTAAADLETRVAQAVGKAGDNLRVRGRGVSQNINRQVTNGVCGVTQGMEQGRLEDRTDLAQCLEEALPCIGVGLPQAGHQTVWSAATQFDQGVASGGG